MNDFLKKLCGVLGLNWVWWQWRWINFKRRLSRTFSMQNNTILHLRTTQKICRCGALAAGGDRACQVCGERLPSAVTNFVYRVLGLFVPSVPLVTLGLTLAIVIDFMVVLRQAGWSGVLAPDSEILIGMGAMSPPLVSHGEWWRLFTCVFLHIGVIHLAFNLIALLNVSHFLEKEIGSHRYLALYLISGLGGSLASYFLQPLNVVSAGASGALFGLIGFSVAYFQRLGTSHGKEIRAFMIRWAIYGFIFGLMIGADNIAHAGGFLTGLAMGALMEQREERKRRRAPFWQAAAILLLLLQIASFLMLVLMRVKG